MSEEQKKIILDTEGRKRISYSQFSQWFKCPQSWKYAYLDGLSKYENNVHCAFGTAIHESIQDWLTVLFTEGGLAADSFDAVSVFDRVFEKEMKGEKKVSIKDENGDYVLDSEGNKTYETKSEPVEIEEDELKTFVEHGHTIIECVTEYGNRRKHFPTEKYELAGIETPINIPVMNNLAFIGYLDIVLKEKATGKIKIVDLKTATRMWNKYQQADMGKILQLLFYKAFYSKQFGVPVNKIDVEFMILKRTLLEGVSFPENRIQKVIPPAGKVMVDEAVSTLVEFIENCFTDEGNHNKEAVYRKNPHKGKTRYSNCKYCEFSCKNGGPCDRKETKDE